MTEREVLENLLKKINQLYQPNSVPKQQLMWKELTEARDQAEAWLKDPKYKRRTYSIEKIPYDGGMFITVIHGEDRVTLSYFPGATQDVDEAIISYYRWNSEEDNQRGFMQSYAGSLKEVARWIYNIFYPPKQDDRKSYHLKDTNIPQIKEVVPTPLPGQTTADSYRDYENDTIKKAAENYKSEDI